MKIRSLGERLKKLYKALILIFFIFSSLFGNYFVLAQDSTQSSVLGTETPTQTPTPTILPSPSPTPTLSPTIVPSPTATIAPTLTIIPTPQPKKSTLKIEKSDFRTSENPLIEIDGDKTDFQVELTNSKKESFNPQFSLKNDNGRFLEIEKPDQFRPGKYHLKITNSHGQVVLEQDFTWGVLAINTNKSIYLSGDTAYLQMAALNEYGHTVCNANLKLEIINPQGTIATPDIKRSDTCGVNNVTDSPDYFAYYQTGAVGIYQMKLKNLNNDFEISDSFEVKENLPFEIERIGATRINPFKSDYTMTLKIKANQDYQGEVKETVPQSFSVNQPISWIVNWKNGETYTLSYQYSAPKISPQIFLLGPLKIADFEEVRQWQIASDSACNSAATGNWATAGTWASPCNVAGGPTSADTVTILTGHVVTVAANAAANSITINSPTTANGIIISSTFTLTVTNAVTFAANTTANNQTITLSGSGILNAGSLNMNNVPTGAGSALIITNGTTVCTSCQLNVTGAVTMTNASTAVAGAAKITMTTGATNQFTAGSIAITGNNTGTGITTVSILTGTMVINGAVTFTGTAAKTLLSSTGIAQINLNNGTISTGGTLTLAAGTKLTSTGTSAVNLASANWGLITVTSGGLTLGAAVTNTGVTITSGTLTLGAAMTVNGNFANNSGTGALTGAFTTTISGTGRTISGSAATTFSALTLAASATVTANTSFTITNALTFTSTTAAAQSLTLGSAVVATLNTVTMNQPGGAYTSAFNINAGTVNASGTVSLAGTTTTATYISTIVITTGTLTMTAASSLSFAGTTPATKVINLSGAGTINIAGSIGTPTGATSTPGTTSTWNFNGSAAGQTIPMATANTYWGACTTQCYANLTIMNTNASGATLGNTVASGNISGNITVGDDSAAAIFNNGGYNITGIAGKTFLVNNNATFNMTGTSTYPATITMSYDAASTVNYKQTTTPLAITSATYGNLGLLPAGTATYNLPTGTLTIAGTLTCGNTTNAATCSANVNSTILDINGSLTIAASSTFVAHATNSFTVAGNWTNNGTFTHSNGTVTFDGADSSTQIFTGNTTFKNFTATTSSNTAGRTLQFIGTSVTTVTGTWTVTGFSGKVITLQSSNTSAWTINPTAANVTYVSVSRSTNTGVAFCSTFSTDGLNNTGWTISAGSSCVSNQSPNSPTSLAQKTTGDVTISTGGWINATSVKFTASATDPDASDTEYLCVEKKDINTAFTNTEDSCGTGVAYSGTAVTVTITISGITDATQYHWQARVKDAAGAYSSWVSYGGNSDTTPGAAADFGIDTTAPTGGTVYDGTSAGVDASFNDGSLSSLSSNWSGFNANASGLSSYDYSVGTTAGGTDVKTWTTNGTSTSITVGSLTLQTSQIYYFNIRANDNAGNSSIVSSNGQLINPSLAFSLNTNSVTFANLNAGNSYNDTKNTVLTTSTNAYNGYIVRAYRTDFLRSSIYSSTYISDFSGGSYATPAQWTSSNYGFGYSSSDTSIQGTAKFPASGSCLGGGTAPCYAPFSSSAPGDIVADHIANVSGSPISNEQFTLTYQVKTTNTQAAGPYTTTLVYTISPQY